MDGFMGEVKMFAGTFAPRGWAFCEGQLVNIADYAALYSLLGTQFGGDGRSNFGLPDLRGRVPVGAGTGPGLTPRYPAQYGGQEHVTLSADNMPSHNHTIPATNQEADNKHPGSTAVMADQGREGVNLFKENVSDGQMAPTGSAGGGRAHENMPPFKVMHYIICLQGEFPERP